MNKLYAIIPAILAAGIGIGFGVFLATDSTN